MLYFTSKLSMHLLEKMALCKRNPIVTKEPQNAIMKRSRFRNNFLREETLKHGENYKIQRSLRKNRLMKTKKFNTYSLITTLIQMNYRMSCSALIFFLYIKKQLRKRKL